MVNELHGISLTNIPLVNLRIEFRHIYQFWMNVEKDSVTSSNRIVSLNTGLMNITAGSFGLITASLQRCLLGLEVYVQHAAKHSYIERHPGGKYDWKSFPKAHQIKGEKRLAAQLFKDIPKLVCEDFSLVSMDNQLYRWLLDFYANVRNPIFHGREIQGIEADALHKIGRNLAGTYKWIDSWYDPHQAFRPLTLNPAIFQFPGDSDYKKNQS